MRFIAAIFIVALLPLTAQASNEGLTVVGRIVKPDGTALTDSNVQFLIQVYGDSTLLGNGTSGSDHCLLYQESQTLDMSNSGGTFSLVIGQGSSPTFGTGVTSLMTVFRNPQTNSPAASEAIGAISCGSGQTKYLSSSWNNDRQINMTVTTSSAVLNLATISVRSVPFALQAAQIGGYSSDYLMRVQSSRPGSANNFSANQFDFLLNLGINAVTPGVPSSYQVTNLLANDPTQAQQVATKNYVDTAIAGTTTSLPALSSAKIWVGNSANAAAAVSMSGDATIDNTGKLTMTGIQSKAVTLSGLAAKDTLVYNGSAWVNLNVPSCSAGQYLTFNGTAYSCVATSNSPLGAALNSAQVWVGNSANTAAAVSVSGDASIDNTGKVTNTGLQGKPVNSTAPTSNQVLQYNGSEWVASTLSFNYLSPTLNDATIWVGNSANTATSVSVSGDASMIDTGAMTVTGLRGIALSATAPTSNQVLQYNGSQWIPTSLSATLPSLNSAQVWIGNSSNVPVGVTPSGDASISNAGVITNTGLQGTAVAISGLSSNQVLQYNGSKWVNASIVTSVTGSALNDGKFWLGNAGNTAQPVSMSGDASLSDTGSLTLNTVPITKGGTGVTSYTLGQVPVYDGTKLTGLGCSVGQVLQWDVSNGFICATLSGISPVGSALTAGQIWYGNASGVAAAGAPSGDVSMSNTGSFKVTQIQGVAVNNTAPSANQVLQYNGSQWIPTSLNYLSPTLASNNVWLGNASNVATATSVPTCSAGYYLTFNGSVFSCALDAGSTGSVTSLSATVPLNASASTGNVTLSMNLTSAHIYVGNASGAAADVAMSGDASIDNTGKVTNTALQGSPVTISSPSANQVLQYNGSKWVNATLSATLPSLSDATIWVGNGSSVATSVTPSGDVSMTDTGSFKVTQIQGVAVNNTAPTSSQVLQYNGSQWIPSTLTLGTVISGGTQNVVAIFNAAGTNVVNSSITDNGATGVDFANSKITFNGSLFSHNDGTKNTFLGVGSGTTTLTGFSNTGVGYNSLNVAGNGNGNSALGTGSLSSNTDGNYNTAVGWNSMQYNVTGSSNTALGENSLNNSTGSSNTAVGQAALQSNGSGASNTAIGYQTMQSANGTSNNTAIGSTALSNPGGSYNVAIGNLALNANTNGASNSALGYDTGSNITSGNSNVLLGYMAGPSTSGAYSNKLYINNAASNAPLIGGDFSAGYVQINNMLEVPLSSSTPTPTAGYGRIYAKADGNLYYKNGTTEYQLSGASSGVTSITATSPLAVSASTGSITASMNLTSAHVYVGNGSGLAADVAMSGDASIDNTGKVTVTALQGKTVSSTAPTANQILQYNGSQWIPTTSTAQSSSLADGKIWVGNSGGTAAAMTMSGDVTMSDTGVTTYNGTVPVTKGGTGVTSYTVGQIPVYDGTKLTGLGCSLGQVLQWQSGTGFGCVTLSGVSPVGASLTAGNIWYGNSSGVAVAGAPSGDVSMSNVGAFTVQKIQGVAVNSTAPTANQVLQYNGSQWIATTPAAGGTTISGGTSQKLAMFNASGNNVINSAVTDNGTSGVDFANSKITYNGSVFLYNLGTDNTFLGVGAANTSITVASAKDNAAVGFHSLYSLTTGNQNTALGSLAGESNLDGAKNTYLGYGAGDSNQSGDENVIIGNLAGYTGEFTDVVVVGSQALRSATSGNENVAVGQAALNSLTTGAQNVAVGSQAGSGFSGGNPSNSVAVGYQALYKSGGNNNTAVGMQSLSNNTTGTNNTALGWGAGGDSAVSNSSSNNVFIGYNANPSTSATYSNRLFINNSKSDTPLIGGDFSAGYVQVNKQIEIPLSSTTPSPNTGYGRVYAKADGNLYYKNGTTEYQLSGVSSGVTSLTATAPLSVSASSGSVTASMSLTSGHIYVGNASTLAADVAMSGDASIDNIGKVTVTALQGKTVSSTAPTSNQILQYNGSQWIPTTSTAQSSSLADGKLWVGNSGGTAAAVTMSGDVTMSDTGVTTYNGTVPVTKGGTGVTSYTLGQVPVYDGTKLTGLGCSVGQVLQWQTGTGFSCTSFTGDVTLASSGATTVTALQGRSVASTAPTTGQVLSYNGSAWVPADGATGSGTTNYVSKWTSSSALGNSIIYDNGTQVGIGTSNPGTTLDVNGNAAWENNTVSSSGPTFSFWKTRNYTALSNNDELGFVSFYGHDGTGIYRSAYIASHVDAAPASGTHTVQGRLEFYTTPSGASDSSERMRITSSGTIGIGTSSPQAGLDIATTGTSGSAVIVPRDTTANRPSTPVNGMIRYNSSNNLFEAYENGNWTNMLRGYIGSLTLTAKASCNWLVTTSWGTMSANSNCNTATADGSATSPGKYPAISFANLAPGKYKVTFNIPVENGSNTCVLRLTDGTNYAGFAHTSSTQIDNIIGIFNYTTAQTNVTFSLQAKAGASNDCYIYGDGANTGLTPVSDYVYTYYVEKIQ